MPRVDPSPAYMESGGINPSDGDLGQPPAYEVRQSNNLQPHDEAPPSYDSLYGRLKHAKQDSDGNVDFGKKAYGICCKSICPLICIFVFWAIAIANIAMGAVFLDDCRAERMIPIYLIVQGVFFSVKSIFGIVLHCKNKDKEEHEEKDGASKCLTVLERLIDTFLFIWFIAGCIFIYRTHGEYQSTDSSLANYCNNSFYLYAFWIVTLNYIIVGLVIVLCCAVCCCICCAVCKSAANDIDE